MRLVLDGRIILPRMSGAGRYVFELARRLPALDDDLELTVLLTPQLRRTPVPAQLQDAGARIAYADAPVLSVRAWAVVPWVLRRVRPDLYHYPHFDLPFVPVPSVVTIYDLNPILLPSYFTRQPRLRRLLSMQFIRGTLRRCRRALVISETVRRHIIENFPYARDKVRTVPLGVDPAYWSAPLAPAARADGRWAGRPYVLYVGVERPHKNLVRLVRAFDRFYRSAAWSREQSPYLWLAGVGSGSRELRAEIQQLGCAANVRLSEGLSESELVRVYREARVVAFVSVSEGFGLPILEAFAARVPLVAGNASCVPEVAGDAATYVAPADAVDIARGLAETWGDEALRARLIERGARRLTAFSWDETARQTVATYRDALRVTDRSAVRTGAG
jgi:alpha-1,3-rhamnosyl/mannosyltransferase